MITQRIHTLRALPSGFTILELLAVVACGVVLLGAVVPKAAVDIHQSRTARCAANLQLIGAAATIHLAGSGGLYPPSYVYPIDERGTWATQVQDELHAHGYLHWSRLMFDDPKVSPKLFRCPATQIGGHPRTNPGLYPQDWEGNQVDQNGQVSPQFESLMDKQAARMAYTANAAIMPRNKFSSALSGGPRVNRLVAESEIADAGHTVLITEFLDDWRATGIRNGDFSLSQSHRPINPFYHLSSGHDEYASSPNQPGFLYGLPNDQSTYGLLPQAGLQTRDNLLDSTSGVSMINAVGRHHPTEDPKYAEVYGGSANFLFCDGHVEKLTALESMEQRSWGSAYYSLSGRNHVLNAD